MLFPDDSTPGRGVPRSLDLPGRLRVSRCFRTTPEGRIAVLPDWRRLLERLSLLGEVAIQTRHSYARLVTVAPVPRFDWCPQGRRACDEGGALHFRFEHWHRAWARLAYCDCCGSPGRIEVCNEQGLDFLQVCALPEYEAADWADFLDGVAVSGAIDWESAAQAEGLRASWFPRLPEGAVPLTGDIDRLPRLLSMLADGEASVACVLATGEACHRRDLRLRRVDVTAGVLTAGAGLLRFQLGLPAVRQIALTTHESGPRLHMAGADGALLLTLAGAGDDHGRSLWDETLRVVFPEADSI